MLRTYTQYSTVPMKNQEIYANTCPGSCRRKPSIFVFLCKNPLLRTPRRQGGGHTFVNQSHKRRQNCTCQADCSLVSYYLQCRLQIVIYLQFCVPVNARLLLATPVACARGKFRPESRKLFMKYLQSTCPAYIIILSFSGAHARPSISCTREV